MPTSALVRV
jgi:hypothetical protein